MTESDETDDSEPETTANPFDDADTEEVFNMEFEGPDLSRIIRKASEDEAEDKGEDEEPKDSDN
ncbi:hypothetical protein [Halorubrum trapanicum]|uniref:hypothetical protein n=1 Tax=Halorubrum trapanicum TaxID=29284 RepID=UPI0012FDECA7|nr:hypothetical protein [Halorubrum trapanicum]